MLLLGVGTCVGAGLFLGHEAKKLVAQMGDGGLTVDDGGLVLFGLQSRRDGGLVLFSPPAVKNALAGPRRDYVGAWRSAGGSALNIRGDGHIVLSDQEQAHSTQRLEGEIAAFDGDDIEISLIVTLKVKVTKPPRNVAGHWEMTANAIPFERP